MATSIYSLPVSLTSRCAKCANDITDLDQPCTLCRYVFYCSRKCRKDDWKEHKKTCAIWANEEVPRPESWELEIVSAPLLSPPRGIERRIIYPFMHLQTGQWLHNRSTEDVYRLLIDAYRLSADDRFFLDRDIELDGIYNRKPSSIAGFRRFLDEVEKKKHLLPSWWSDEKREECENFGLRPDPRSYRYVEKRVLKKTAKVEEDKKDGEKKSKKQKKKAAKRSGKGVEKPKEGEKNEKNEKNDVEKNGGERGDGKDGKDVDQREWQVIREKQEVITERWSSLFRRANKWTINEHYEDESFANQLRIFAEDVYGSAPGCMSMAYVLAHTARIECGPDGGR